MKKINHIFLVLGLAIFLLLLVFLVKFVRENVFYSIIALLVIYLLIYWRIHQKYEKYDIYLIMMILAVFTASRFVFRNIDQPTLVLRTSSILAFILLHPVLLIGPWSRFSDKILKLYHYRRHLGVTVFLLGALHAAIILPLYFEFSLANAFASIFTFYGFTSFFLMLWLALTSWDYVQKTFKDLWWKLIHGVLFIIYASAAYYVYTIQKLFDEPTLPYHLIVLGLFLLVWIAIAPYSIIKRVMRTHVFGWKQLHVLIWIVYFSTILHVLLGALTTASIWIKAIFWASIVFVLGSHAVGWIMRFVEDNNIHKKIKSINKEFNENGKHFVGIADANDFEDGKGKKFYINKNPVAVFKTNGNFFAVSNVCCHQKGPIFKGKVQYGTVECPWHYWVYNLKDGKFLGKENFCLPVYETVVREGVLFVSKEQDK